MIKPDPFIYIIVTLSLALLTTVIAIIDNESVPRKKILKFLPFIFIFSSAIIGAIASSLYFADLIDYYR